MNSGWCPDFDDASRMRITSSMAGIVSRLRHEADAQLVSLEFVVAAVAKLGHLRDHSGDHGSLLASSIIIGRSHAHCAHDRLPQLRFCNMFGRVPGNNVADFVP